MKATILFLLSMISFTACTPNLNDISLSPHPKELIAVHIYTGKVVVLTESGKPCKEAMVSMTWSDELDIRFYADSLGAVVVKYIVNIYEGQNTDQPESIKAIGEIYKQFGNNDISQQKDITVKRGDQWDEKYILTVIFPDEP